MNQNKKGSPNHQLSCNVCEVYSMSSAEYALHEFTKKHCDNLIRVAKNKPVVKKPKKPEVEKETVKVNTVTHTGSFAKYGYFVPGEIYMAGSNSKEFNLDYDPYLQKFAENPLKEKAIPICLNMSQQQDSIEASTKKKKKKKKSKIKTCYICNVPLPTIPQYEAHMKSPEHILKLKMCGMGVTAHFVKASSDLHTTETKEGEKDCQTSIPGNSDVSLMNPNAFEVPPNSFKMNFEKPVTEKLFCYTCDISLNTVFQYNEHKQGKKHKAKCRALIRKGMTVPPEERVPGIGMLTSNSEPIYPEYYVKMILERQKQSNHPSVEHVAGSRNTSDCNTETDENQDKMSFKIQNEINLNSTDKPVINSNITFQKINFVSAKITENSVSESKSVSNDSSAKDKTIELGNNYQEQKKNIVILKNEEFLHCGICDENFQWQFQYDSHLTLENHLKKIVDLKASGKSENEILELIFADRSVVKPNNSGKLTCSICKVTVDNQSEFLQHLSSVVHKYAEKDYQQKRTVEVRHMIPVEDGVYCCKLCKEKLSSLVELCQHFFKAKHKIDQKRKKIFKKIFSYRQRLSQNLKKKYILLKSLKAEKNPGITETNVPVVEVFNSELLKSDVESTKSESKDSEKSENNSSVINSNAKKSCNGQFHSVNRSVSGAVRPFLPGNFYPSRFPNHPSFRYSPYPANVRNAPQFYNSHPPVFGPLLRGFPMGNASYRGFQRPPWRNFR